MDKVEVLSGGEVRYKGRVLRDRSDWLPAWAELAGYSYLDETGPRPRDPVLVHGQGDQARVVAEWESVPSLGELWEAVEHDAKERRDAGL